ncbi:MAG: aromatic acid decarboxylase [Desulfuromonas sp.]|nr:MAG: aromatic acid decarboxylase [Desulfuromonas sp.]
MRFTGSIENIVVAITGASGSCYALRLIECLLDSDRQVSLLITDAGRQVLKYETGEDWSKDEDSLQHDLRELYHSERINCYAIDDFFAPVASGSAAPDAVVIVPCSMGTAGRIASGLSENLLERVADVALKERRDLIMVPRETPLNQIHLENLLRLSRAGAHILPAMPGFYQKPTEIAELVDFVVGKILDSMGIEHALYQRWGDAPEQDTNE